MVFGASVLVGRRAELAALERVLGEVERGETRAIGLRGEPGIGKSRLLGELAGRARERGLLVLVGRATELERDLTLALWMDALEPVLVGAGESALSDLDSEQLRELAVVLPAVGAPADAEAAPISGERHIWRSMSSRSATGPTCC